MKIGGLASGIDTESIIKDMMQANRLPLNKVTQKKQYMEWQLANYRATNLEIKKFSDSLFSNMILSDQFKAKTVEISSPSALSVKNLSSTADFSGELRVGQLAKNSTMQGQEITRADGSGAAKLSDKLEDLGVTFVDGKTSITINAIGADGKMPGLGENGVSGVTLEFTETDTIESVLNKINKETGVTAFFDSQSGKIGISSKHGGALENGSPTIEINGELAEGLKLSGAEVKVGQNAIFEFNGMEMTRSSNTFSINGFEFTLKDTTTTVDENGKLVEGGSAITFSSTADVDSIFDNVMKFVDDYNKMIEDLNEKIREPKYRDFHPLSTEEKAEMKDKEIELWEEKAMSGTLRNDPLISSMLSEMRTALMGSVGGEKGDPNLKGIGITTSNNYMDNGKLVVDEAALRKAIADDPDKVHKLFSADGEKVTDQGFARRLRGVVDGAQKQIEKRAGTVNSTNDNFTLGKNLIDMDKQIARFEQRLEMTENRLWKQFTAMEVAIQRANAQSAQLMNSLGGM